jgi:hypothetical protein
MNLETKITIYKFTPQLFTLTLILWVKFYSRIMMLTSYQPNIFCESI